MEKDNYIENSLIISKYEAIQEHSKWLKEIPYIPIKDGWEVQISPPFAGAVVRFRVKSNESEVSVYLDCYDRLGIFGSPYWEVYPYDGDVYRVEMNAVDELIKTIQHSIENG